MNTWPPALRTCSSNGRKPLRRFTSSSPITSSINRIGGEPILLIDDVMGELDVKRRSGFLPLLEHVRKAGGPGS